MVRLTLTSLRAHAVRLALSSLAIVLGVAFIAGTFIFTDGLSKGIRDKAGRLDRHTSVAVDVKGGKKLEARDLDAVRKLPGVRAAEGTASTTGALTGRNGRPVPGFGVITSVPLDPALQAIDLTAGRMPQRPGEAVLDGRTAKKQGFGPGDTIKAASTGPGHSFALVGIIDVAGTRMDMGGPVIGLAAADVIALAGTTDYAGFVVAAAPGTTDDALAAAVKTVVGDRADVLTNRDLLDRALKEAVRDTGAFGTFLLTFALVSVLVAAFVIANTFTIVLAQRTREIALLRLVGGTRGQAFRSVLVESAVVGLFASVAGLVAGIGVAAGLRTLLAAMDAPLTGGLVIAPRTIVVALLAGIGITVASALIPAWKGTRVPPVAALSDSAVQTTRRAGPVRLTIGALSLALGVAALVAAAPAESIALLGVGGVLGFLGIVLFGPVLVPALVRLLGAPLRGGASRLAVANAVRNPRRIAATATALVIGISLVSAFLVSGHSTKAGIEASVDRQFGVDYLVVPVGAAGLPAELPAKLGKLPESGQVHARVGGYADDVEATSADPGLLRRTTPAKALVAGDLAAFRDGTAVVSKSLGRGVGQTVTINNRSFRVVAVLADGEPGARQARLTDADMRVLFPEELPQVIEMQGASGVAAEKVRTAVENALADYPTATLMDRRAYKEMLTSTVDTMLAFVTALLGLAVVIALVGVANTLTLSVVERTRENGVLRAVGLTRGRMRGMLAVEAAMMALVGALLGIGLGTAVSAGAMNLLNRMGGDFALVLPWGWLATILGVAAVAALLASVLPARRAVSRPVVEALATE